MRPLLPAPQAVEAMRPAVVAAAHAEREAKGWGDLDDLIGQGYLGLAQAVRTFDPAKGTFLDWAARNVAWCIKDYYRRESYLSAADVKELFRLRQRLQNGTIEHAERDKLSQLESLSRAPLDQVTYRDPDPTDAVVLREALERLPYRQAAVIRSVLWVGLTFTEAGAQLAISESTACDDYHAGLRALRRALKTL